MLVCRFTELFDGVEENELVLMKHLLHTPSDVLACNLVMQDSDLKSLNWDDGSVDVNFVLSALMSILIVRVVKVVDAAARWTEVENVVKGIRNADIDKLRASAVVELAAYCQTNQDINARTLLRALLSQLQQTRKNYKEWLRSYAATWYATTLTNELIDTMISGG